MEEAQKAMQWSGHMTTMSSSVPTVIPLLSAWKFYQYTYHVPVTFTAVELASFKLNQNSEILTNYQQEICETHLMAILWRKLCNSVHTQCTKQST